MSTTYSPLFTESCKTFNKAQCTANKRLLDPCSCQKYFLCVNKKIVPQGCALGTAYDYTSSITFCRKEEDIYLNGLCVQNRPWLRCKAAENVSDSELTALEARCTGVVPTPKPNGDDESSNAGAIVGGVIGGIILIAIVIGIYFLYKRGYTPSVSLKKKTISKSALDNRSSFNNPEYFGQQDHHIIDETYASIDEETLQRNGHVNGLPSLPERPPSLPSSQSNIKERKSSVVSLQSYMEPSPTLKYGFHNHGLNFVEENGNITPGESDRQYTEILPETGMPSNGHITLHNHDDDPSPYDNSNDWN